MSVIDHSLYPHIIDLVFDHAPLPSLEVMSLVCREWRREVLNKFYHVRNFFVTPNNRGGVQSYHLDFGTHKSQYTRDGSLFRECRILDVHVLFGYAPGILLNLPCVTTMRMPSRGLNVNHLSDCYTPNVTRIVYENRFSGLPMKSMFKIKKIVVNWRDAHSWPGTGLGIPVPDTLDTMVFVDHDNQADRTGGQLVLPELVSSRAFSGCTFIFVGQACPGWINEVSYDSLGGIPLFKTFEEYKAFVGEREFAIETDWDFTATP